MNGGEPLSDRLRTLVDRAETLLDRHGEDSPVYRDLRNIVTQLEDGMDDIGGG